MITDLLSEHEVLTFAKILADRDEGFIELAYQETGEEGRPLAEATKTFFEKVAAVAKRPVLYQAVAPNSVHPEQHRERIRWLESCTERGLRVYGQGATRRGGFEMTFEDWNLFDDTEAWRDVTLGTKDERKAKMQDPADASSPQGGMGCRDPADDGGSGFRGQPDRANEEREDRYWRGIGVSHAARAVEVGGASYFLVKTRDGYRLLSTGVSASGRHGGGRAARNSSARTMATSTTKTAGSASTLRGFG